MTADPALQAYKERLRVLPIEHLTMHEHEQRASGPLRWEQLSPLTQRAFLMGGGGGNGGVGLAIYQISHDAFGPSPYPAASCTVPSVCAYVCVCVRARACVCVCVHACVCVRCK